MDFSTTTWIIIALVALLIGAAIWMLVRRPAGADDALDGQDARIADRDATLGDRAVTDRDAGAHDRTLPEEAQGVPGDDRGRDVRTADEPFDQSTYDAGRDRQAATAAPAGDRTAEGATRDGYADDLSGDELGTERRDGYAETGADEDRGQWRDAAAIGAMGAAGAGTGTGAQQLDRDADRGQHTDADRGQTDRQQTYGEDRYREEAHRDDRAVQTGSDQRDAGYQAGHDVGYAGGDDDRRSEGHGEVHQLTTEEVDAGARHEPLPVEDQQPLDPAEVSGAGARRQDDLQQGDRRDGDLDQRQGDRDVHTRVEDTRTGGVTDDDHHRWDDGGAVGGATAAGATAVRPDADRDDRIVQDETRADQGVHDERRSADDDRLQPGDEGYLGAPASEGYTSAPAREGYTSAPAREGYTSGAATEGYTSEPADSTSYRDERTSQGDLQRGDDRSFDRSLDDRSSGEGAGEQRLTEDRTADQRGYDQRGGDQAAPVDEPVVDDHPAGSEEAGGEVFAESIYGAGSAEPLEDGSGPAGWQVKGNAGSMLFHTADSPSYDAVRAEVWFESEEAARNAGFAHWDRRRR